MHGIVSTHIHKYIYTRIRRYSRMKNRWRGSIDGGTDFLSSTIYIHLEEESKRIIVRI